METQLEVLIPVPFMKPLGRINCGTLYGALGRGEPNAPDPTRALIHRGQPRQKRRRLDPGQN